MSDLRQAAREGDFPHVLFVFQGTLAQGRAVLHGLWPDVRAVHDASLDLYRTFGLRRGRVGQLFGPGVWAAGLRALRKGHAVRRPVGDPWMMPGMFLVADQRVLASRAFRHAGDHPAADAIRAAVADLERTPT